MERRQKPRTEQEKERRDYLRCVSEIATAKEYGEAVRRMKIIVARRRLRGQR